MAFCDVSAFSEVDEVRAEQEERRARVRRVADVMVRTGGNKVVVVLDDDLVREERAEGAVRREAQETPDPH